MDEQSPVLLRLRRLEAEGVIANEEARESAAPDECAR